MNDKGQELSIRTCRSWDKIKKYMLKQGQDKKVLVKARTR